MKGSDRLAHPIWCFLISSSFMEDRSISVTNREILLLPMLILVTTYGALTPSQALLIKFISYNKHMVKKKTTVQVRDGVQLVECLISIHEALGLSPSTIKRGRGRRRKWVDKGREEGRWYRQNHEHPFKGVSGIHPDTLRGTQQGKQSP